MNWWSAPIAVSVSAFATTIHAAFIVLRRHRGQGVKSGWLFLLPAVAFASTPWVFPNVVGVVAGFLAQLGWFMACEKFAPPTTVAPVARPAANGTRPTVAAARPAASKPRNEFAPVPVLAVHRETDTIKTFRLLRPEGFSFQAGQFLMVRLEIDGQPAARCYSISSAPESTGYMEISVRKIGVVSNALHASLRPGSMLYVKQPAGSFTYPARDDRPLVLLAGGIGITPLLSMLRHAVVADPGRPVTLIYSSRSESDIAFRDELMVLAARHPQIRVLFVVSEPSSDRTLRVGVIDQAIVSQMVNSPADSLHYLCGPPPMMDAMRAMLAAIGVPANQVRNEVFQPATAIGARTGEVEAASDQAGPTKMILTRSNQVVTVPVGATLLEAAETAGATIPSLCRAGVCGTCKTRLASGEVHCTSDALDDEDKANNYILPCVSWPSGDVALEA